VKFARAIDVDEVFRKSGHIDASRRVRVMSVIHNLERTLLQERWQAEDQYAASRQEIEEWLAVGLAMIAGFLDSYGIITYHTYVSFMSGNTTQAGYNIGQGNFLGAADSAIAIIFFVGGSFAGALLAHSGVRRIRRLVFWVIAASLASIIGFAQLGFLSGGVHIAAISFVMGAMNIAPVSGWRTPAGRRTIGEPDLCDRDVEQDRGAPRPGGQACGPPGQPRSVGYTSAPGSPAGGHLGRVSIRRIVVGGSDTTVRRVGFVVPYAHPVGARGFRRDREHANLTGRATASPMSSKAAAATCGTLSLERL
jgi:hypothetical protein